MKRHNLWCGWMGEDEKGEWVRYEDAEALYKALDSFVQRIETIKHDRQHVGTYPDWFDWCFINQELKKAKKVLGGEG